MMKCWKGIWKMSKCSNANMLKGHICDFYYSPYVILFKSDKTTLNQSSGRGLYLIFNFCYCCNAIMFILESLISHNWTWYLSEEWRAAQCQITPAHLFAIPAIDHLVEAPVKVCRLLSNLGKQHYANLISDFI